ncbi:TetR/AcrR family transcriptional regulator [Vitiosangium sp. GDMCC 1.1324]|uniref:TetR/AcrR family transcriptional regulator n=1 Tax=Vitiosangium sp. (strain GDMCC 1.1324) TaxID=2138576 RepID=UPI000D34E431|nr:TetR/AcrR family transcriptional regulator [Vitiosangium sp. GDMCC 1.1324]PTL85068.1 TetR family transcriptional regulator [Vitiosangium sp. GDMCC 1.1324]
MPRSKEFDPDAAVGEAMELFWTQGYATTSPQQLGERMGIGRGSLYNAFKSKHALFELVLRRYHDLEAIKAIEFLEQPGPVKERVRRLLRMLIESDLNDPQRRGCLITNTAIELAGRDETATKLVARTFDRLEDALEAVIQEGQRSGELEPGLEPRSVASFLLNAINGLRVLGKTAEDSSRLDRVVEMVLRSF